MVANEQAYLCDHQILHNSVKFCSNWLNLCKDMMNFSFLHIFWMPQFCTLIYERVLLDNNDIKQIQVVSAVKKILVQKRALLELTS